MGFAARYVAALSGRGKIYPLIVLGTWLALAATGGALIPLFFAATTNDMGIPNDAPSLMARQVAQKGGIVQKDGRLALTVMIEDRWRSVDTSEPVKQFYGRMQSMLLHQFGRESMEWSGFIAALEQGQTMLAKGYIGGTGGRTGLVRVDVNPNSSVSVDSVARYLHQELPFLSRTSENASVTGTVLGDAMNKDVIIGSVTNDLAFGDGVAMPISLFVLGITLRSFRLCLIPVVCFAFSALTTYGLMAGVASAIPVISAAASLVSSILIAFSFDYCLFQLSRFVELSKANMMKPEGERASHLELIELVLETAGHTCLVSGGTLFLSFLCLVLIPQQVLRGFAAASCCALFVIVACQLTVVPSLLLLFPNFFSPVHSMEGCPGWMPRRVQRWWMRSDESEMTEEEQMKASLWYRLGDAITRPPWNWVVFVSILLILVPFGVFAVGWPVNDSILSALPRGDEFTAAVYRLLEAFGRDSLEHYYLIITPAPHNVDVKSPLDPAFVDGVHAVLTALTAQVTTLSCANFATYVAAGCRPIDPRLIQGCLAAPMLPGCPDLLALYESTVGKSPQDAAISVMINHVGVELGGPLGRDFYDSLVDFQNAYNSNNAHATFRVYVGGGEGWDGVNVSMRFFPMMVCLTGVAMFLLLAVVFRSALIPLRSLVTIGMTVCFVYGAAALVYVHGALSWLSFPGLASEGSVLWMPPLVSFSIVSGLCLDYDIFLLTRVFFEHQSHEMRESIIRGLWKTGRIVTSAGVIMAIAFSSLLFSTSHAMNLLSFYTVAAVLFDTFVVRALVVPALFSITLCRRPECCGNKNRMISENVSSGLENQQLMDPLGAEDDGNVFEDADL